MTAFQLDNSHQRMMSYDGTGDLQTDGGAGWESHPLVSEPSADLERRWVSVPPNVWHQAVVSGQDWAVVSFHTAAAAELIEERPDPAASAGTRQKRYLTESLGYRILEECSIAVGEGERLRFWKAKKLLGPERNPW